LSCLAAAVFTTGCGDMMKAPTPYFTPHARAADLTAPAEARLTTAMIEHFGSPNQLVGWQRFPLDYGTAVTGARPSPTGAPDMSFDGWRLKWGRDLYMQHCIHCHGVTGNGDGPTAPFLNPRPRDYRQGVFKFTSTQTGLKPTKADLATVLKNGIPGTSMPSYVLLGQDQINALVMYVQWLSSRGEVEIQSINELAAMGADKPAVADAVNGGKPLADVMKEVEETIESDFAGAFDSAASNIASNWKDVELPENIVVPTVAWSGQALSDSIARGKEIFNSQAVNCAKCHGAGGAGNGPETDSYIVVPNSKPERTYTVKGLHDMWGNPVPPRNLTRGVYRGGRRPVDLYRRVAMGVKGTPMGGFSNVLNEEQIWDVVNYVMSIPFGEQPFDVRDLADGTIPAVPKVAARGQSE
jgi:mono/diheme cytochrome c family protein